MKARGKRAKVEKSRKNYDESTPPKNFGLGLIEQENDQDEIIGLRVHFVKIFAEDLEELKMQDWSLPTPSHEKLELEEEVQVKILEPKVIPHIHAFFEKETEIKVAAHDVEVSVPKVAAFFSDETEPKVATLLIEVEE